LIFIFTAARNAPEIVHLFDGKRANQLRGSREALSSPFCKNILIFRIPKSVYIPRHPVPHRGALRNVTSAERAAVDAEGATDERAGGGRRRRVVLMPRRWHQVLEKQASQG